MTENSWTLFFIIFAFGVSVLLYVFLKKEYIHAHGEKTSNNTDAKDYQIFEDNSEIT